MFGMRSDCRGCQRAKLRMRIPDIQVTSVVQRAALKRGSTFFQNQRTDFPCGCKGSAFGVLQFNRSRLTGPEAGFTRTNTCLFLFTPNRVLGYRGPSTSHYDYGP